MKAYLCFDKSSDIWFNSSGTVLVLALVVFDFNCSEGKLWVGTGDLICSVTTTGFGSDLSDKEIKQIKIVTVFKGFI